jgi:hypothetical protein
MATTSAQDTSFIKEIISTSLLEDSISWIASNLSPDDVFDDKTLLAYAAQDKVENVFTESELEEWAENNGYTKQ